MTRTRSRGWLESLAARPARLRRRRGRPARLRGPPAAVVGDHPPGVRLPGAHRHGPGPGRARAGQRGADEQPGQAGGSWRWQMKRGALTAAPGPAAARGDRGGRPAAERVGRASPGGCWGLTFQVLGAHLSCAQVSPQGPWLGQTSACARPPGGPGTGAGGRGRRRLGRSPSRPGRRRCRPRGAGPAGSSDR